MTQTTHENRQVRLRSRPVGLPTRENFSLESVEAPTPNEGQIRLRTLFLSLDPYMRGRMSDAKSYAAPLAVGDVILGGTISRVDVSHHPNFQVGDLVLSFCGWQDYAISDGKGLTKLEGMSHPSHALGVLGMPGFTGYMGLMDIGQPKAGETVVVAAASGPVGSVVGQIAKLKGCRAVGIAGGPDKCKYVVEELGFDACLDHRGPNLREELKAACPGGIDVYFENVGGKVLEAVLPLLNSKARVPVCGLIAHYNDTALPEGPNRLPQLMNLILTRRLKVQGFIVTEDYRTRFGEFFKEMSPLVEQRKVKVREDIVDGLENAPEAFIGLLQGKNFGKLVVRVGT